MNKVPVGALFITVSLYLAATCLKFKKKVTIKMIWVAAKDRFDFITLSLKQLWHGQIV